MAERRIFEWVEARAHIFEDSDTFIKNGAIAVELEDMGEYKRLELMCQCMRPHHSCGGTKEDLEVKTLSSEWQLLPLTFEGFLHQKREHNI
jgi:hypothetical protein